MKRAILLITAVIVPLFFCLTPAFPKEKTADVEKITLKKKDMRTIKNKGYPNRVLAIGEIHSDKRGLIGTLIKVKRKRLRPAVVIELFNKNENYTGGDLDNETENYVGRMLPSDFLRPKGAGLNNTKISAENATLFLDALKVVDEMK